MELRHRCQDLEEEVLSLNNQLETNNHYQQEAQGKATHFATQYSYRESELQVRGCFYGVKLQVLGSLLYQDLYNIDIFHRL